VRRAQEEWNVSEGEAPPRKNLAEIIGEEEDAFQGGFLFVWEPNPNKDHVRVSLDDGSIRMYVKRDKFLALMLKIMDVDHPGTDRNYFRIKESLHHFGGHFLYDRVHDEFRELQEIPVEKRLSARYVYDEARKNMAIPDRDSDRFYGLTKTLEDIRTLKMEQPRTLRPSRFSQVVQRFIGKRQ
jgi:hypothetical protein